MASTLISVLLVTAVIQVSVADVIFLYEEPNYQGASKNIEIPDGDTTCYTFEDFETRVSSVRVTAGSCFDLYEYTACMGNLVQVTRDNPNLGDMNNRVSSIRQC